MLRAAYRHPKGRHLARFILIALYTGTRTSAILGLQFMPNTQGGHVDTVRGIMHRRGIGVAETKKRTPPIPLPRALLAHMRRALDALELRNSARSRARGRSSNL